MNFEAPRQPARGLLTVLTGAVGAGPLLLYGLSATSEAVIRDLGISTTTFGLLASVCFICAAGGNLAFGRISDKGSDIFLLSNIFILSSLALILAGLSRGYEVLLVAAAISGFAQSFSNGISNRILVDRVPLTRRFAWMGIKQSGVQVSQLFSSLCFPVLAIGLGWRGAALLVALVPLLLLIIMRRILRKPLLRQHSDIDASTFTRRDKDLKRASGGHGVHSGLGPVAIWSLTIFGFFNGVGIQATNVYIPLFAVRELDYSQIMGGVIAAFVGVVGVIGRVGWARIMARGVHTPSVLLVLALTSLTGAGIFTAAGESGWSPLIWFAAGLHGVSALGVSVVLMSTLLANMPTASIASTSGVVTAGMFTGFTLGPVWMGWIISTPGGFRLGWLSVTVVYLICIIVAGLLLTRGKHFR